MARKVDEPWTKMSKLHRSRLDTSLCTRRSGSSQLASDETLSRTSCTGTETRSVDYLREMYPSPTLRPQAHGPVDVRLNTVIGISAGGSGANVTSERQHGEGGEGHDCRSRGTEASKEEGDTTNNDRIQHCVLFWSGIQCYDQLGNSIAQRNFDTTITSVLTDNSSLAPLCREHPPEGKDESPTGKMHRRCRDAWHGNFSEAHRWSMLVSQRIFKRCWMRRLLIDVILSRSVVLMLSDRSRATTWALFVLIAAF